MDLSYLQVLETIDPRPLIPWRTRSCTEIEIEPDREKAREKGLTCIRRRHYFLRYIRTTQ